MKVTDLRKGMLVANSGDLGEVFMVSKRKGSRFMLFDVCDVGFEEESYFDDQDVVEDVIVSEIFRGEL